MQFVKKIFSLLLLFAVYNPILSQSKALYNFQQDDTLLKRKYYNEALQKKGTLVQSLPKQNIKDYQAAYNSMFEVVEDLLISSRSVTDQAADNYLKAIVAKIIKANPELTGLDTRIVFSRDFSPNAYSIGDGTIAFNAGLFIFLNNEAEMAFVICHELAHYYLEHSKKNIDRQVEILNSDSLKKEFKRLSKQEYKVGEEFTKLLKTYAFDVRRHSRKGEEEADKTGLRFLKNTGYSGDGFITSMQVLDKIDDTSLSAPLQLQKIWSFPKYPFKDKWIKNESAIFGAMNEEDASNLTQSERDSLKTHPDCLKRIALLKDSASA